MKTIWIEIQITVSINRALLEYSLAHLRIVCGCFQAAMAELGSCNRDDMAQEV